jgi:hypothetical protein
MELTAAAQIALLAKFDDDCWDCLAQRSSRGLSLVSIFREQVIDQDDVSAALEFTWSLRRAAEHRCLATETRPNIRVASSSGLDVGQHDTARPP